MWQAAATVAGALLVVFINWVVSSNTKNFVYGQLTQKVQTLENITIDHGRRITNIEGVVTGKEGHGERLVRLEYERLEQLRKQLNG